MTSRNVRGCRMLVTAVLSMFVFQMTATAQLDEAERLIYLAKAIKRIVVKQIDKAQPEDASKAEVQKSFAVTAYDKDGKVVNVSSDQANKLYKWTVKSSSGTSAGQKGVIEQIESANDKTGKARNVLKLAMDKGQKAAKLEVRLADQFSTYSSAVGKSSIAMGKGGAGMFKSIGQWIGKHPYWSTAGGVVAVGGGVAIASNSGGGGGSSSHSGTGVTTGTQLVPSGTVDVSGTWHGVSTSGENPGQSVTLNLSQSGTSVSGTIRISGPDLTTVYPLSGSVNGNVFTFSFTDIDGNGESTSATVNGNTMAGSQFTASR
ncbi:MAG: hypothetical protein PHR77_18445 [Kiritimatiellae bacterium]|nr:hypothetical protein [Kiritimatiellia bacterium]MDD5520053.1 hypothetical protein [Kiritimatiellia bacterium]